MMWEESEEPLYDERILGELVHFIWWQKGPTHFIRAEWHQGPHPWEKESAAAQGLVRNEVIAQATQEIEEIIRRKKATFP